MTPHEFEHWLMQENRRPLVMGVLNVTPDSFSDGGRFADLEAALAQAQAMCAAGADWIDIGGESTRPGARRVEAAEQLRRILPVFQAIKGRLPVVLSVDTTLAAVAEAALEAGASVINDISAAQEDAEMLKLAARRKAALILMHMQGQPATMQANPHYDDVVGQVQAFLARRLAAALEAGVEMQRVLLDPGIGFGKSADHNLLLLRELGQLTRLGRPLVLGTSRKAFIGRLTGEEEPAQRLFGTAATVAWSVANGAAVVRVHDVKPMAQVVKVIAAIQAGKVP